MKTEMIVLIVICVSFVAVYWKGRNDCAIKTQIVTLEKVVTVREKQNEIRNKRPDSSGVSDRLRKATF